MGRSYPVEPLPKGWVIVRYSLEWTKNSEQWPLPWTMRCWPVRWHQLLDEELV